MIVKKDSRVVNNVINKEGSTAKSEGGGMYTGARMRAGERMSTSRTAPCRNN